MKYINKTLLFLFLFIGSAYHAQQGPPNPPPGGGGGTGPGGVSSPIDMYIYILAIVAMLFILYFGKKLQKKAV